MKEIKAYLHRHRAADVVRALVSAGFHNLCLLDVKAPLHASGSHEQDYSLELGTRMVTKVRLELMCENRHVFLATELITEHARTDQPEAGWIYVSDISYALSNNDQSDDPG